MIAVDQPKIAGLAPRWARFAGFSLLFDPPFLATSPSAFPSAFVPGKRIETLAAEGRYGSYGRALDALDALDPDRLLLKYGFCALPPASYHVTAFDVANVADLPRCRAAIRDELSATLDRLPEAAAFDAPFLRSAAASELASAEGNLEFGYGGLALWSGVLVVRLEPRDPAAFARFVAIRAALARELEAAYGVGAGEGYTPHLSLGYFLNAAGVALARPRLSDWDRALREAIGEETLAFHSVSLYGFTDMATFCRRTRAI